MISSLESKEDFERMFPPDQLDTVGDQWLIKWRGSQTLRYDICLEVAQGVLDRGTVENFLDIGCAQSIFLMALKERFPSIEFHGSDISENVIEWNRKRFPGNHYSQCALPEVGFPLESLDFISALEVVYYLDEQGRETALRNMAAALRPGGYLLISGVLDGGARYFSEDWIVKAVSDILEIEKIEFNYARMYSYIERMLLRAHHLFQASLADLRQPVRTEAESGPVRKSVVRRLFARAAMLPVIGFFMKAAAPLEEWLIRALLGRVWMPELCSKITKYIMADRGKSHIIILARKV